MKHLQTLTANCLFDYLTAFLEHLFVRSSDSVRYLSSSLLLSVFWYRLYAELSNTDRADADFGRLHYRRSLGARLVCGCVARPRLELSGRVRHGSASLDAAAAMRGQVELTI